MKVKLKLEDVPSEAAVTLEVNGREVATVRLETLIEILEGALKTLETVAIYPAEIVEAYGPEGHLRLRVLENWLRKMEAGEKAGEKHYPRMFLLEQCVNLWPDLWERSFYGRPVLKKNSSRSSLIDAYTFFEVSMDEAFDIFYGPKSARAAADAIARVLSVYSVTGNT